MIIIQITICFYVVLTMKFISYEILKVFLNHVIKKIKEIKWPH